MRDRSYTAASLYSEPDMTPTRLTRSDTVPDTVTLIKLLARKDVRYIAPVAQVDRATVS